MFNVYEFFNKTSSLKPRIRLDVGQPDISVDKRIIEEAVGSLRRGETGYTKTPGLEELREKIAEVEGVGKDDIIVGNGSKILIASQILRAKQVGIISPHWQAYESIAREFGKDVKIFKTSFEEGWEPRIDRLGIDLLILNYPNNPTGKILPKDKLREILERAEEEKVKVLSDESYSDITFKPFTSPRELYENVITVKSFSKLFSMTGFRLGYAIAQREDIKAMQKFLEATTTCLPIFIQRAGVKALEIREEIKDRIVKIYEKRARLASRILKGTFEFYEPDGAFYLFVKTGVDGLSFAEKLLEKGVSVFPGIAFGDYRDFIRISLVSSKLEEGLKIIKEVKLCASE
ncbi:MAG: aspartate aminotransferase [Thermococcaceae archaeon]|uniref:pyridoxal phosphate-dependent aminotransferase n=1 Tax=Thermococcus sp. PK TaxID=913025 RepID=UPI0005B28087|nr:aminotransferase class I/II-fold pyridoxal phosphate-dependent enzyme [Thermococcus sp. PK]MDK2853137.1 aspartate aminotransferase [Thermococcaceae archaeon]MDK2983648.1 aspartate aminotransferase [Thermococcaceae archaeon]MDN5319606.1 aspartate aminotransferase [Thermococcaceae archaeon]